MMNRNAYAIISIITFLLGLFTYAYLNSWIIIRLPSRAQNQDESQAAPAASKKKISLFYWKHDQWRKETAQMTWYQEPDKNIESVTKAWLSVLEDEGLITTPVRLQSVMLAPSKSHAYISFDRNLLPQDGPIFEKWHRIEALLKTIRENDIPLTHVQFLVDHQPMLDYHLEFVNPWPVGGFLPQT
jgi:hypothetical protein